MQLFTDRDGPNKPHLFMKFALHHELSIRLGEVEAELRRYQREILSTFQGTGNQIQDVKKLHRNSVGGWLPMASN